MYPPPAPRPGRLWAVVIGAVMTLLGAVPVLTFGMMCLFGVGDGTFLGGRTDTITIENLTVSLTDASTVGVVFTAIAVALVVFVVLALRRHPAGPSGLTLVGVLVVGSQVYMLTLAGDVIAPLVVTAWIAVAVAWFWFGTTTRRAPAPVPYPMHPGPPARW